MVTPVVASPLNDPTAIGNVAQVMLDKLTVTEDYELTPRMNINTAPKPVLKALMGVVPYTPDPANPTKVPDNVLSSEDIDKILAIRPTPGTNSDPTTAWLVGSGGITPLQFKTIERYVCARSGTYRVRSVGYFGNATGPQASAEAVIEVVVEDYDGTGAAGTRAAASAAFSRAARPGAESVFSGCGSSVTAKACSTRTVEPWAVPAVTNSPPASASMAMNRDNGDSW